MTKSQAKKRFYKLLEKFQLFQSELEEFVEEDDEEEEEYKIWKE